MKRLAVALAAVSLLASPAFGAKLPEQYEKNLKGSPEEALARGSSFLAGAQKDLKHKDGQVLKATWPFTVDSKDPAPNSAGIVARALVAVHANTADAGALAAAKAWGEARIADVAANRTLFDPDVEALADLARATKQDRFAKAAKEAFEQRQGGANGREIVERLFWVRKSLPSIVGFDAAATVRAARAVGDEAKAAQLAGALAETQARWAVASKEGFELTSYGAVLEATAGMSGEKVQALRKALKEKLLAAQGKDGAWGVRNTQATAYAVRGLRVDGDEAAKKAAAKGALFLRATQLKSGGWATFNDLMPEPFVGETVYEVSAEAVLALAVKG